MNTYKWGGQTTLTIKMIAFIFFGFGELTIWGFQLQSHVLSIGRIDFQELSQFLNTFWFTLYLHHEVQELFILEKLHLQLHPSNQSGFRSLIILVRVVDHNFCPQVFFALRLEDAWMLCFQWLWLQENSVNFSESKHIWRGLGPIGCRNSTF